MATKVYKPKRKISATESEEIKIPASSVDGLSTVATSGSYNDLSDKPTIPSVPTNYVTTDTAQTISGAKTFTAQPIINTSNGLKFTSGNCALRIYNTSASPTDYSAIEVRSNSTTKRNLFVDLDINSLVVGQASGTADTTYKVNVKDSFNATTIYENGTPLSDKYCSDNSKHGYTELTNENLNDITDVGWYRAAYGNSCTFVPEFLQMNKYAFILIVEKIADGTYVRQTVYGMENYNAATYGKYVRTIRTTSTGTTASFWEAQYTVNKNSQTFQGRKSFIDGINIKNSLQVEGSNGTSGQVLTSQGEGKTPIWADVSGGGSSDNSKHGYTELTNENLNTITEAGWYRAASNSTCANKPSAFTSIPFILEVEKSADVYIKQTTYTTKNSSDAFSTTYVRFSIDSGNTWTSWGKTQTMSDNKIQTFSGLKTFSGGIDVFYSPLRFNSDAGSGGKFVMSQGATTSPKWVNLQVRVNGTTYTADSSGLIDLGEISGGGSASTSQYNDIY